MNRASLVQAAVWNETARHEAALRAQGLRPRAVAGLWRCVEPGAGPFHAVIPQSAEVGPEAIREAVAEVLAVRAGMGVLDPWSVVELEDWGFELDAREYWVREPAGGRAASPPELEVRRVESAVALADFAAVGAAGFGGPTSTADHVWREALLSDRRMHFYVGYVAGSAVAASQGVVEAGAVGVYGVATAPAYRGRGYGEALTWAALDSAPELPAVLEPSEMGAGVYRRMGFEAVWQHRAWLRGVGPREN